MIEELGKKTLGRPSRRSNTEGALMWVVEEIIEKPGEFLILKIEMVERTEDGVVKAVSVPKTEAEPFSELLRSVWKKRKQAMKLVCFFLLGILTLSSIYVDREDENVLAIEPRLLTPNII